MSYSVTLVYEKECRQLSVKGRTTWRTKKTAIKHAQDIAALKTRDGIMCGLIGVQVWRDDFHHVLTIEVH